MFPRSIGWPSASTIDRQIQENGSHVLAMIVSTIALAALMISK